MFDAANATVDPAAALTEARLRSILASAPNIILTSDLHGKIRFINRVLPPFTEEQVLGASLYDFAHPHDVDTVRRAVKCVLETGQTVTYEARGPELMGVRWFSVAVGPLVVSGEIRGITMVVIENTELKQLQARLMVADRMESVGTLAAGVAHEINNPLTYVLAGLQRLQTSLRNQTMDRDVLGDLIRQVTEGTERIAHVVRSLRTFSHPDDSRIEAVDIPEALDSALRMVDSQLTRVAIVREYGPVSRTPANPAQIGQVFVNLLLNAAHALHGNDGTAELRVRTFERQGRVIAEVIDNGCGIPGHLIGRVFEPFMTTKPSDLGTGLGLYICHNIVRSLGGQLDIESTEGRGTTVRVTLPSTAIANARPNVVHTEASAAVQPSAE